jgi:hypothetical protein
MAPTQSNEDDRWQQAYNNAAELLFGLVEGDTLTEDQDAACVAEANDEIREGCTPQEAELG